MANRLFAKSALLADGWAENILLEWDCDGDLTVVQSALAPDEIPDAEIADGPVLPGMTNLHSHAFQRAMAGLAERQGDPQDSFWTWREVMYGFLARITPEDAQAIAAQLYLECLKRGYTAIGEFHYLHHGPGGAHYDNIAEMSCRVMQAAQATGIAATHLPVLYAYGGFGATPLGTAQQRFKNDPDGIIEIISATRQAFADNPNIRVGLAPHSLRAVDEAYLTQAVTSLHEEDHTAPVHIHIAEQVREVEDCLAWSGQRPVEWLYDKIEVDGRWCLVHATHLTDGECDRIAASKAVAGICPTTEANLGDGLFPFLRFREQKGIWGIGSDSHVSQCPVEELRLLEYGQRLTHRRRNLAASETQPSVGATLWTEAAHGGAQALARNAGTIAVGKRADLIVLDADHVNLHGKNGDQILDALVFSGNDNLIRDVMVGGHWRIRERTHPLESEIRTRFKAVLERLTA
ncbi:formimidoylglutamate deiminase [Aestuariispira insulae]|uniref:Formimidoylglutamate deiminase n=1 Tax=Aestuariispira insulae TaxID=1461337 RepID=A0A3D9HX43_9PROT|nr:formimidoylglutamate deiminase [Aestuariispira insulae]RED53980.1 formimidoylglutamate deiminase [Aestuariispira insulae]